MYALGNLLPQALGFLLLPVFTKYLSPQDYGVMNYYGAIVQYLLQFALLSINTYLLRNYFEGSTAEQRRATVGNVVIVFLLSDSLTHILAATLVSPTFRLFHVSVPLNPYSGLVIAASFLDAFTTLPLVCLRMEERAGTFLLLSSTKVLARYLVSLIALIPLSSGLGGKMVGDVVTNAIFAFVSLLILWRRSSIEYSSRTTRRILKFSLPFFVSSLLFTVIDNLDRFFLERYLSLSQLGIYSIGLTIAVAIYGVMASIYRAIEPSIYRAHGTGVFQYTLRRYLLVYYATAIFVCWATALLAEPLVRVLVNSRFGEATKVLPDLMVSLAFSSSYLMVSMLLAAERRAAAVLVQTVLGVTVVVLGNLALIPFLGVHGAVASKYCSYLAMTLYGLIVLGRLQVGYRFTLHSVFLLSVPILSILYLGLAPLLSGDVGLAARVILVALLAFLLVLLVFLGLRKEDCRLDHITS